MQSQTFFYGDFVWPPIPLALAPVPRPSYEPSFAVEILQEYGPTQVRGKLHTRAVGDRWTPVQPSYALKDFWYAQYQKDPEHFAFDMQGTGAWSVLYFRIESDSNGLYFAVALSLMPVPYPAWLEFRSKISWK